MGDCELEADVQFNGDAKPAWKTEETVELTLEQNEALTRLLQMANTLHHRCGGLIKLQIETIE